MCRGMLGLKSCWSLFECREPPELRESGDREAQVSGRGLGVQAGWRLKQLRG